MTMFQYFTEYFLEMHNISINLLLLLIIIIIINTKHPIPPENYMF